MRNRPVFIVVPVRSGPPRAAADGLLFGAAGVGPPARIFVDTPVPNSSELPGSGYSASTPTTFRRCRCSPFNRRLTGLRASAAITTAPTGHATAFVMSAMKVNVSTEPHPSGRPELLARFAREEVYSGHRREEVKVRVFF